MSRPRTSLSAADAAGLAHTLDAQSSPDGLLICDGRIRILGFSEPLPAVPTQPLLIAACGVETVLPPGRYGWCSCGYSLTQPFCDHSHRLEEHATNRKSYKFEVLAETPVCLCVCKSTAVPPFCDGQCLLDAAPSTAR